MRAVIGNGPTRLQLDAHKDGVVELWIGGLRFPISRDDLVKMLFGEPGGDAPQPKGRKSKSQGAPSMLGRPPTTKKAKTPPTRAGTHRAAITEFVHRYPGATGTDVSDAMSRARGVSRASIQATMWNLVQDGTLKTQGKRGAYRYFPGTGRRRDKNAEPTKSAQLPRAPAAKQLTTGTPTEAAPAELTKLAKTILQNVAEHPGTKLAEIASAIATKDVTTAAIGASIKRMVGRGLLRRSGKERPYTYTVAP